MNAIPVAISYSGGTSSEWMVEAVIRGELARPENVAVFFADTGGEHQWTYDAVNEVELRCERAGLKFIRCQRPDESLTAALLSLADGRTRIDQPPIWIDTGNGRGRLPPRCSQHWKSRVLRKAQAAWLCELGLPKRVITWIGFASDEAHRAIKANARQEAKWASFDFPAIRAGKTRGAQRADLVNWTGRAPKFSMCVYCPYKSPKRWRQTEGADLSLAIRVDEAVRNLEKLGVTDGSGYLCDQLIPVSQLVLEPERQSVLPGLESYCDGGACFL